MKFPLLVLASPIPWPKRANTSRVVFIVLDERGPVGTDRFFHPLPCFYRGEQYWRGLACGGSIAHKSDDTALEVHRRGAYRRKLHGGMNYRDETASRLDKKVRFEVLYTSHGVFPLGNLRRIPLHPSLPV